MGNSQSAYVCNGATNHSDGERQPLDYYATEPKALELLLDLEQFDKNVWECACGSCIYQTCWKIAGTMCGVRI